MIGVDWGTSNFRAFRLGAEGAILDRRGSPLGILHVPGGRFAETLSAEIGDWLRAGEDRVLLCGMVGSRQGWQEAPYVPCPAGIAELARAVTAVPFTGARVRLVTGISTLDPQGVPDVIRGEETKIVGVPAALGKAGLVCLPGTHSKWVSLSGGRIARFATHMTGEVFGVLREHSILGRMMRQGPPDWVAFDCGLARAAEPGGWLHHLFGVRTLGLTGELGEAAASSYLSGLLIGHEVRAALPAGALVHLLGAPALTVPYARAIAALGGVVRCEDEDAAARGLAAIGAVINWDAGD
ncbi:MAG: 2-dehydro-3-deoxygalactonokinase [Rhodospirillales bacterium]|nr:2-dehydro-3-deoxygalactonokinase [Rhodospirillales bacterium]